MSAMYTVVILLIAVNFSTAINVSFPPKSLSRSIRNRENVSEPIDEQVVSTTSEIDISAVNVTNLTDEVINKIAEGLPPEKTARKDDVFIVYAQSVKDRPIAVALPQEEAVVVEAQKLMQMVADDLDVDASNNVAMAARSRLTPEERREKLQMRFRPKQNLTQDAPKTKRYSYTDNFEPLKLTKPPASDHNPQDNLSNSVDETTTAVPATSTVQYIPPPPRHQVPPVFYPPTPNTLFQPPNKQFYGYVRHDLHVIDGANKNQQPYLSLQQPLYNRNNLENFQAHVQHPPVQNFYRPVQPNQVQAQFPQQTFPNPGFQVDQQPSFFGRILPMFG